MNHNADTVVKQQKLRLSDCAILALLPAAIWIFFEPAMILQRGTVDSWFYTGMAGAWEKMIEGFGWGWTYYYLRFPIGFLHRLFLNGSDPVVGYLLLRWLLMVVTGAAIYVAVLRIYGRLSAIVTYFFMLNAMLFMRIIVSDYPSYLSIPMAMAGIGLWLAAGDRNRWLWCFGAGVCFAVSGFSHIFSSSAFGLFAVGMVCAQLWHGRKISWVLADAASVVLGFVAICGVGLLYMRQISPGFTPAIFGRVMAKALADGGNYASSHLVPFLSWGAQTVYVYIPFLLWLAALVLRDKDTRDFRRTAIVLGSGLLLLFYSTYRFGLGKFVFEEISYFIHTFILAIFLVPASLAAVEKRTGRPRLLLLLCVLAGVLCVAGAHLQNRGVYPIWVHVWNSYPAVITILLVACASIVTIRLAKERWLTPALFCFFLALNVLGMPTGHWVFASPQALEQENIYRAGIKFAPYWAKFVQPGRPPLIWLKSSAADVDILSLSFITQCNSINDKWQYGGMPAIGDYERTRLTVAAQSHLLLLGRGHPDVEAGTEALLAAGYEISIVEEAWMDAPPFRMLVRTLKIKEPGVR